MKSSLAARAGLLCCVVSMGAMTFSPVAGASHPGHHAVPAKKKCAKHSKAKSCKKRPGGKTGGYPKA